MRDCSNDPNWSAWTAETRRFGRPVAPSSRIDAIAHVSERQLASYFERAGERWRLTSALRQRASWHVADATTGIPAGPWHVILCRNLFIYLTADVARRMSGWMADALVPGGRLVLGKAEALSGRDDFTHVSRCVYRKHGD